METRSSTSIRSSSPSDVGRFNIKVQPVGQEFEFSRILIYGVTGSGKTTLAKRLSAKTGIPWHSVDGLTYEANWVQAPDHEQRRRISAICEGQAWILDTAYAKWIDVPLQRVELIVALDYPRIVSLFRLFRRTLARAIDGRPICNGNRESLRTMISRNSILLWHFQSFHRKRERIRGWSGDGHCPRVLRFRTPREVERFLA